MLRILRHLGFGALAALCPTAPAAADVYDVDALNCGQLACAAVYQGEGVDHRQLVVEITSATGGLATPKFRWIYDSPPGAFGSVTLWIDAHLAQRVGGSAGVTLSEADFATLMYWGPVLVDGMEQAFNSPDTHHLGFYPTQAEWLATVAEAEAAIPQSIHDWDAANDPDDDAGTGTGGAQGHAVGGLVPVLNCVSHPSAPNCPGIDIDATPVPGRAAAAPLLAQVNRDRRIAVLSLTARPDAVASGPSCSETALMNRPTLEACKERCDDCEEMLESFNNFNATYLCGAGLLTAGLTLGPETFGVSSLGALLLEAAGAGGICGQAAVFATAAQRDMLNERCKERCELFWDADAEGGGTGGAD
ncbi:hypothetical protein [Jannaschia rubra]|uniref:hypothetical protein n=1 Tax=Jannaschia rubra TaxID=282197 RepID=UPI0024916E3D|nr:hypothetical protein [Jannaschia rubra]